ncbi:MAG: peptide deformylase [Deltaproteobacteria bacterium]|nr:peptide deformylase [Deltaproteobacteria bacterium]
MALREILIWPDPRLKKKSLPVTVFDDDLKRLAEDMLETMYANDGVGLAAPQVGLLKRMFTIDIFAGKEQRPADAQPLVIVNPEFLEKSGSIVWDEGCLSVPGETAEVKRAGLVRVRYQDVSGAYHEIEASELLGVALQHETDHLDGVMFVDRIGKLKRDVIRRKMLRLKQDLETERAAV